MLTNEPAPLSPLSIAMSSGDWVSDCLQPLNVEVLSIAMPSRLRIPTRRLKMRRLQLTCKSYFFAEEEATEKASPKRTGNQSTQSKKVDLKSSSHTRIHPPKDVIRLQDRLFYTLQPPLETLLEGEKLTFPLQPFPHQLEGIAFLYPRHAAVLADEMGLGKTMQAATAIRMLLRRGEVQNVLLLCPKPLVTNWQREFETWAPEIPVSVISGDRNKRTWQWRENDSPVKLANYELMLRDDEIVNDPNVHFDLVVLDEAQRIKNRGSSTSKTVCNISRTRSWAMTGTPVENSAEDLVGIFEFLSSGLLNSNMKPKRMAAEAKDYIIRRTKETSLKDMPPCLIHDADIALTAEQQHTYDMAEENGVLRLNSMGDSASIQHVFELVLRLKQICNFDPATGSSHKLERLQADMEEIAASGKKAIVFSQWVESLKHIKASLKRFHPLEYHGRIPSGQRDPILKKFREDKKHSVILMSYGAGSVGLNLQFCNYVFLFDRWWNPAVEDQAINRAHRIGSTGSVTVTRFLSSGTIEERIHQVLEEKRELFDTIVGSATGAKRGLSQSDIFGLFGLKKPLSRKRAA